MNNNPLMDYTLGLTERTYKIAGDLELHITVTSNPYNIPLDALFAMAARINKKRSFLFVSKVLGKHIPLNPYTSLLSGTTLALLLQQALEGKASEEKVRLAVEGLVFPENAEAAYKTVMSERIQLQQPITFIGFAETATAIGHAVYETFGQGSHYLHTTREVIEESPSILQFEEEHSHATAHYGYSDDPAILGQPEILVLVDDEITTGKTSLNIIRDLQGKYPKKIYYVLALLDWRTEEDILQFAQLEKELQVTIHVISLISGYTKVHGSSESLALQPPSPLAEEPTGALQMFYVNDLFAHAPFAGDRPYLQHSGRFGLTPVNTEQLDRSITQTAERLKRKRTGSKTLCVGTGEFMYIPMRIAAEMGAGVSYQSTTRSPIHVIEQGDYAVKYGHAFPSPEDENVVNFFYNIAYGMYQEIFLFMERETTPSALEPILRILQAKGLHTLHIVFFSPQTVDWKEARGWKIGDSEL
ncbi:phosphoribosyltransferase family protein [Paenibacillus qinlingensis]|uniref:Adenine/guanine phosphoribosyltransferase n=1 Tax=Paenibacillus qinlingensis TaxID=1837343 RepID=A0ABU1P321_9BACL|nr:phosphoribosyltransferase family protein [Paenibacillus qinlingensis]MDR6554133.1 hypothetical protein [Paenibacillus qinlingensis]